MYIEDHLKEYEGKRIKLFVDMDGVIADYDVGFPSGYDKKRPLKTTISKLEEISKRNNIEMFILSVTRMDEGIEEKNIWLDKFAPFFKKENRVIISRESNDFELTANLKSNYLKSIERDDSVIIVIDDDPLVLKMIGETSKDIIRLKDTAMVI